MEFLILLVGVLAIGAATAMLITENAVYSALFLVLNMLLIAFMFILLDAPFLAMVQIAVYAGAIMVLFLFVIMLLGAEKTQTIEPRRQFRWVPAMALGLALAFVFSLGATISNGQIDSQTNPPTDAYLRVFHAAPASIEAPAEGESEAKVALSERRFDVYLDGELVFEAMTFDDRSAESQKLIPVAPGEHTLTFNPAGTTLAFKSATLTADNGEIINAVLYGATEAELNVATFETDNSTPSSKENARMVLFNAHPEANAIDFVDIESEIFTDGGRKVIPIASEVGYGTASAPFELNMLAQSNPNLALIETGRADDVRAGNRAPILLRVSEIPTLELAPNTVQVLVLGANRGFDGSFQSVLFSRSERAVAQFGSPQAVGLELFSSYPLPLQLVAILLLAAMVGVIVLTLREQHEPKPSRTLRRKVSRPLTSVISSQTGSNLTADAPLLNDNNPNSAGD